MKEHVGGIRFFRRAANIVSVVLILSLVTGGTASRLRAQRGTGAVARYEGVVDPLLDYGKVVLGGIGVMTGLGMAAAYGLAILEVARLNSITLLAAFDAQVDTAMAIALTTNTIKDFKIAAAADINAARQVIRKLKGDLAIYEEQHPSFERAPAGYAPSSPGERTDWQNYTAIRDALKQYTYERVNVTTQQQETVKLDDAEVSLERDAKAVQEGLNYVLQRLTKVAYALPAVKTDSGYIAARLAPLRSTLFGINVMAEELSGKGQTPMRQLRLVLSNTSKDLVFLVQLEARQPDGTYVVRPDTQYPIPIYPDVSGLGETEIAKLQTQPTVTPGRTRGRVQVWLPVNLRDRLLLRVATMGQVRDRIRFMPVRGGFAQPDLNSLTRTFYYFGYEAHTPQGTSVSQWYPAQESYSWAFGGSWRPGETANDPKTRSSTPDEARRLRGFGPTLVLQNDRLEWVLPAGFETASQFKIATATVTGDTIYKKYGPNPVTSKPQDIPEHGAGVLSVELQRW